MDSNSVLVAHVDCRYATRGELATLPTPAATRSWKPIPHYELVTSLAEDLGRRGITVAREQYAVGGKGDAKIFGVLDLLVEGLDDGHVGTSLGLRAANDKSMRIQVIAAARVFVCDNMAFSGSDGSVLLSRKHTSRLDLSAVVPPAIDSYLDKAGTWKADIDRMRGFALTDRAAKEIIYDSFLGKGGGVLPLHMLGDVHRVYFDDAEQRAKFHDRSLWSLNNAFTEVVKGLKPLPQQRAGLEIGRYFGRVLHRDQIGLLSRDVAPIVVHMTASLDDGPGYESPVAVAAPAEAFEYEHPELDVVDVERPAPVVGLDAFDFI